MQTIIQMELRTMAEELHLIHVLVVEEQLILQQKLVYLRIFPIINHL